MIPDDPSLPVADPVRVMTETLRWLWAAWRLRRYCRRRDTLFSARQCALLAARKPLGDAGVIDYPDAWLHLRPEDVTRAIGMAENHESRRDYLSKWRHRGE